MQKISNAWNLREIDVKKLASFAWKAALILFGLKFISDVVALILYVYASTDPLLKGHRSAGFGAAVAELSTAATMLLQLLAWRLAIEVALHLTANPKR
ncbi:hypothetical protein ACWGS9_20955 [Bradyrhizobium sp. Arg314]